jgi:rod shape determining protein RodA
MNLSIYKLFAKFDWILFVSILLLLVLSLAALYPISQGKGGISSEQDHFTRQLIFAVIGLVIFFFFAFWDYRSLKNYSNILFFGGIAILILVLIIGKVIRGTTGWVRIGEIGLQPVEPFKIVAAIVIAKYFSLHSRKFGEFKHILISLVPLAVAIYLVLKQPDLGSAIVLIVLWLSIVLISGVNKKYIVAIFLIGVLISSLSWGVFLKSYQKERIRTFLAPFSDPQGAGYNVIQSTVAVGSGGMWGKGLGHGSQSQLNFLPEKHTDFIFALIAEEMGFSGAMFTFILLLIVIFRLCRAAQISRDNFGKLLVGGLAGVIFFQCLVNIGMNIGIVPVAGIPLPFLSYGGSSLITVMAIAGISESVYRLSRN